MARPDLGVSVLGLAVVFVMGIGACAACGTTWIVKACRSRFFRASVVVLVLGGSASCARKPTHAADVIVDMQGTCDQLWNEGNYLLWWAYGCWQL
jgi:hypothetical protein